MAGASQEHACNIAARKRCPRGIRRRRPRLHPSHRLLHPGRPRHDGSQRPGHRRRLRAGGRSGACSAGPGDRGPTCAPVGQTLRLRLARVPISNPIPNCRHFRSALWIYWPPALRRRPARQGRACWRQRRGTLPRRAPPRPAALQRRLALFPDLSRQRPTARPVHDTTTDTRHHSRGRDLRDALPMAHAESPGGFRLRVTVPTAPAGHNSRPAASTKAQTGERMGEHRERRAEQSVGKGRGA
jgi:hypothetical protein